MRILHFCPSRSFSGLEQYSLDIAKTQFASGHQVTFAVAPGTELENRCKALAIPTVEFNIYKPLGTLDAWKNAKVLLNKGLDVIHMHSLKDVWLLSGALLLNRTIKPKIIVHTHIWLNHKRKDPFHMLLYKLVDELWVSSNQAKTNIMNLLPIDPNKVIVVPYGRDTGTIQKNFCTKHDALNFLKLNPQKKWVGTISRIEKGKGILEALEAAIEILPQWPEFGFAIIGGPSPNDPISMEYYNRILKMHSELSPDLKSRIIFSGQIESAAKYLKAFDLYVLPSYQECFSLALLDAQLAQLPTVGTRSGGTPEVVVENQTGWLANPENSDSLAQALKSALSQQNVWDQYGKEAHRRVSENYNDKKVAQTILSRYSFSHA